jgi:hypothetical protein
MLETFVMKILRIIICRFLAEHPDISLVQFSIEARRQDNEVDYVLTTGYAGSPRVTTEGKLMCDLSLTHIMQDEAYIRDRLG